MHRRHHRHWRRALICGATLFALSAATAQPRTVPDTMAERVKPCTACHGKEGVSTPHGYFPRIAGKPAGYLHAQLLNFRDGRRSNGAMSVLLENLSDFYLLQIAQHFAALELPYAPPPPASVPPEQLARGEALVRRGDQAAGLPACVDCHGAAMTGVAPAVPGLLGLPRDYLIAQLGAWRNGQRRAAPPDCMNDISRRLSPGDLAAVAAYLAAQAVPADPRARSEPLRLPVPCGSVKP